MKKFFGLLVGSLMGFMFTGLGVLNVTNAQFGGGQTESVKYNPDVPGSTTGLTEDKLIVTIKMFINRTLALLGLIALIVLLRGGFQMVTAAGDDAKYKKGFKILQQAGMGLIFIGIAWLFVSVIFWIVAKFTV